MALIKCHECEREVSTEATVCPNCGAKPRSMQPSAPTRKRSYLTLVVIGALVLVAGTWGEFSSREDEGRAQAAAAAEAASCMQDLKCWGNRNSIAAEVRCPAKVERLALHSVRWRDGDKLVRFRWKDKAAGTLTYIGDRAEFQNGFGAYTPVVYECDFDPGTKTVLDVRAQEGRLP